MNQLVSAGKHNSRGISVYSITYPRTPPHIPHLKPYVAVNYIMILQTIHSKDKKGVNNIVFGFNHSYL